MIACNGGNPIFDRENEIDFYGPIGIEVHCISKDRPAEVLIGVEGLGGSGCRNRSFKNIYVDRVENTISLKPTELESSGGGYTCSGIEHFYGEVTLKDLDVGEYEITVIRGNSFRLRIEKETAAVLLRPRINITTVEMKTSKGIQRFDAFPDPWIETTETVQVTLKVEGYFAFGSHFEEPPKITDIKREGTEIRIDISGEVGFADCRQDRNLTQLLPYDTQIDLGLFEAGTYHVTINENEDVFFSIRLPQ